MKIQIDHDVYNYKMTLFEKIMGLIKRLAGSYDKAETYLLQTRTKIPLDFYLTDGRNGRYLALHKMSSLLKKYKKENENAFNQKQYESIMRKCTSNVMVTFWVSSVGTSPLKNWTPTLRRVHLQRNRIQMLGMPTSGQ